MKNNRGFTLIETFGAITILILAVIGPLALLSRNLADASLVKSQMTATYLAQEAIELVINHRDTYVEDAKTFEAGYANRWLGRLANFCTGSNGCNVDLPDDSGDISIEPCLVNNLANNPCQLVLVEDGGVSFYRPGNTNAPNAIPTVFKRSIFIVPFDGIAKVTGNADANNITSNYFWDDEGARVTVVIDYSFRGRPKKYVLSTIIYNQSVDGVHQDTGDVEF